MAKFSLGTRLFLSHFVVLIVGFGIFVAIARVSSPQIFVLYLDQIETRGFRSMRSARTVLVEGFQTAWNRSTYWSVLGGAVMAGGLGYVVSRRIVKPLEQMDEITQKYAAGHLQERMEPSEIPELDQLSNSFNRMAGALEGVEQRRRDLVTDVTHELRTPLTTVRGYLEELADGSIQPTPELYGRLSRETRRLERLIQDLQDLSQSEMGYLPIDCQPLALTPLLESLVERFSTQLLDDGPQLLLECPAALPKVRADRDRTEQVLINLLGNALRHTETGSITLRAELVNHRVKLSVTDTGPGIAPENLPHIFERFWRAERSRPYHAEGTGVGLAIAKRLVELQGGQLEVISDLDQGSSFFFSLAIA